MLGTVLWGALWKPIVAAWVCGCNRQTVVRHSLQSIAGRRLAISQKHTEAENPTVENRPLVIIVMLRARVGLVCRCFFG